MELVHKDAGYAPKVDMFSIGNTTLDTSAPVGQGAKRSIWLSDKWVIVLTSRNTSATESGPNLKAFGRWYTQHSVCKLRLHLIKRWLTQTNGDIANDTGHCASYRIVFFFCFHNTL